MIAFIGGISPVATRFAVFSEKPLTLERRQRSRASMEDLGCDERRDESWAVLGSEGDASRTVARMVYDGWIFMRCDM